MPHSSADALDGIPKKQSSRCGQEASSPQGQLVSHRICAYSESPPHNKAPKPTLLKALELDDVEVVRKILDGESYATWVPPFEHSVDPLLCTSVEMGCKPAIVNLLLARGADPFAKKPMRQTAVAILKLSFRKFILDQEQLLDIVVMLTGATPSSSTLNDKDERASVGPCEEASFESCWSSDACLVEDAGIFFLAEEASCSPSADCLPSYTEVFGIGELM